MLAAKADKDDYRADQIGMQKQLDERESGTPKPQPKSAFTCWPSNSSL
jgi:hypothetical protein